MSSTRLYQLPVETTEWKFDGKTEIAFTWEYEDGNPELLDLYEKGKKQQWNATTRIDWSQELEYDKTRWACRTRPFRSTAPKSGPR
jgi:hypothetical protein